MTAGMTLASVPHASAQLGARKLRSARKSRARNDLRAGRNLAGSQWLLSCNNWRMARPLGSDLAAALSKELIDCRKRGIERLDVRSHNQQPLSLPVLDRLAADYAAAKRSPVHSRIPRLKYLLRDAVTAFGAEEENSARLVAALFFGDSLHQVTKSAGELLDVAERQFGYTNNTVRFRQTRHAVFERFAEFLPRFVAGVDPDADTEDDPPDEGAPDEGAPGEDDAALLLRNHLETVPAAEVERHIASTGYIDTGDHFVTLLSQAENVTIVGHTNESLASMFQLALDRKRAAMLRPDGCWASVRVVFLTDDLLDRINDERGYPDLAEARLLRRRLAVYGRRTVRIFLRSLPERTTWAIYDSPFSPPLTGALFEMPGGQRIVHMVIRRPQRSGANHLYLELEDTRGHYFSAVFNEIVENAVDDNKLVPAGRPVEGERFLTQSTRFRRNVLQDGKNVRDWLPMVLVITWQMRGRRAEPLLQLRTPRNATREFDRFTHLAGHITQEQTTTGLEFGLDDSLPMTTAAQRVQMETGESGPVDLTPLGTGRYFHHDKEHLFFFVYACRLPDGLQVWQKAEMFPMSAADLMAIRENQVLRNALALCQSPLARRQARGAAFEQARGAAFEIIAQNLILHGHPELAAKMLHAATAWGADLDAIAAEVRPQEERTRQTWPAAEGEAEIVGLSGFQFREFFRTLLPLYESIGVPGAARQQRIIRDDQAKWAAMERLSKLYADELVMESIPIEL